MTGIYAFCAINLFFAFVNWAMGARLCAAFNCLGAVFGAVVGLVFFPL